LLFPSRITEEYIQLGQHVWHYWYDATQNT